MPLSVMSWNVENLFPPGSFTSPTAAAPVSQQQFDDKIRFLAEHILDIRPDVVALQEIGGATDDDLTAVVGLQDALQNNYPFRAVSGAPDGRRIKVAFLSRLELTQQEDVTDFPAGPFDSVQNHAGEDPFTRMSRGALHAEVEPSPGTRVRLVTLHLKSKLLTFPRSGGGSSFSTNDENLRAEAAGIALLLRTAEAVTVRTFLNREMEANQNLHAIVLGDFNDAPKAATSQIFLGPTDKDITTADGRDHVRLYNLTDSVPLRGTETREFLPVEERFTRLHEGAGEVLDQIMASRSLVFRNGDFRVLEVRSFVNLIEGQSISDDPTERVGAAASDHAPVLARFDV
jgi:endonuclease/exonuclease/phosphatase family metal-dependent hydrolase